MTRFMGVIATTTLFILSLAASEGNSKSKTWKLKHLNCTVDQIAKFDGSAWICAADEKGDSVQPRTVMDGAGKIFGTVLSIEDHANVWVEQAWEGYNLLLRVQPESATPQNFASWGVLLHEDQDCLDGPFFPNREIERQLQPHRQFLSNLVDSSPNAVQVNLWETDDNTGNINVTGVAIAETTGDPISLGVPVDPDEFPHREGEFFLYTSKSIDGEWVCEGRSAFSIVPISVRAVEIMTGGWSDSYTPPFKIIKKEVIP